MYSKILRFAVRYADTNYNQWKFTNAGPLPDQLTFGLLGITFNSNVFNSFIYAGYTKFIVNKVLVILDDLDTATYLYETSGSSTVRAWESPVDPASPWYYFLNKSGVESAAQSVTDKVQNYRKFYCRGRKKDKIVFKFYPACKEYIALTSTNSTKPLSEQIVLMGSTNYCSTAQLSLQPQISEGLKPGNLSNFIVYVNLEYNFKYYVYYTFAGLNDQHLLEATLNTSVATGVPSSSNAIKKKKGH